MGTSTIVAIVVVVVLVAAAVLLALPMLRRRRLRDRFGSEYDRAVDQHGDRSEAERDLRERERRHAELELRPLPAGARAAYTERWDAVQARFVDEPQRAVDEADQLVGEVMAARGYPVDGSDDRDERAALLSVEHARSMDAFRAANDTRRRADQDATTENLREAMVQYRTLFTDLLGDAEADDSRHVHDDAATHRDGFRDRDDRDRRDDHGVRDHHVNGYDSVTVADAAEDTEMREARADRTRHTTR
jgi:hypothetical protein